MTHDELQCPSSQEWILRNRKIWLLYLSCPPGPPFLVSCVFLFLPPKGQHGAWPTVCAWWPPGMTSPGFNHSPVRPLGHVINGRMRWSKPVVLFYFPVAYLKPASCSEKHVRLNTRTACFMRKKKITKRPRKEIEKRLKHTSWGSSLF